MVFIYLNTVPKFLSAWVSRDLSISERTGTWTLNIHDFFREHNVLLQLVLGEFGLKVQK